VDTAATAERIRRHRARKRAGQIRVTIDLALEFVVNLVELGWLCAEKREGYPIGSHKTEIAESQTQCPPG
jgi:hypothetical protein